MGKNEELEALQKLRENAKNQKAYNFAQAKIDEYFLGEPKKSGGKKKKKKEKKYINSEEDEWSDYIEDN